MTIKSIEERIFQQADEKLRKRLKESVEMLDQMLRNGTGHTLTLPPNAQIVAEVPWYQCLHALMERAFELNKDREREKALEAFMNQVTAFKADYADIQAVIEGGE